jgi:translation initiation factor 6 (eIF-6)
MAVRVQFENNNEVGVFSKLTNSYCLVAIGGSENFYRLVYGNCAQSIVMNLREYIVPEVVSLCCIRYGGSCTVRK